MKLLRVALMISIVICFEKPLYQFSPDMSLLTNLADLRWVPDYDTGD